MYRASRHAFPATVLAVALLLSVFGLSATADPSPAPGVRSADAPGVTAPATDRRPAGAEAVFDRALRVDDGRAFHQRLRDAGMSDSEIDDLTRRQRDHAIRVAYASGDERSIAEIEAQLPETVIAAARGEAPDGVTAQASSVYYYSCGAGSGVWAQFKVFGSWDAYFETTGGSRTSVQSGHCSDFWNGCVITDSIGGNPAITWRFHKVNAFQLGYHTGGCS